MPMLLSEPKEFSTYDEFATWAQKWTKTRTKEISNFIGLPKDPIRKTSNLDVLEYSLEEK